MDFLLVTVLSFGIFVGYNAQPAGNLNFACRNEEEYDMCRSPCENTCESIRNSLRRNCTQSCVAGCFCREGLVRARDRSCILPEECNSRIRPVCKENEEFQECGSPCAANCSTLNDPIFCTKPCHSGCFCKQDFVRDSKGNCVHPRNCYKSGHKQCPLNEHYVDCINFCNTCWENGECRNHYCTPGCDCKPGFYRNFYGQCVSPDECATPYYDSPYPSFRGYCGENEIYTDCVNMCNDCLFKGRCNLEYYCEPGCDCKHGYFRNDRGICVPEQLCFRKRPICSPDEQYYSCVPTCRATCDTYSDSTAICDTSCTPGCFCKSGLIRRNDGKCVSPKDCPARNPTCPAGEAFYQCLPTCRITCETLNTASGECPIECRPGCFCQPGFVRNSNGRCVHYKDCQVPIRPACSSGKIRYYCFLACCNTCKAMKCPRPCFKKCRSRCFCRRGFVLNRGGKFVRPRNYPIEYTTTETNRFDPRRGGVDNDDITDTTDLTTVTSPTTTEDKPNVSDTTQNDSQSPTSSFTVTTRPTTSAATNNAFDGTASMTDLTSAGVDSVNSTTNSTSGMDQLTVSTDPTSTDKLTLATDSTSTDKLTLATESTSAVDKLTLATGLASPVTNVMSTTHINTSENTIISESTTLKESSTILSISTQAVETSSTPTTEESPTTKGNNGQTVTFNTSTDSTNTENLFLNSTVTP